MSDTTVTGTYISQSNTKLVFEIYQLDTKDKKLGTDEETYLVLLNGKSKGIYNAIPEEMRSERVHLKKDILGFEITKAEFDNFQTNIIDKEYVIWHLTDKITLPGTWTSKLSSGGSKKSRKSRKSRKFRKSRKSRR